MLEVHLATAPLDVDARLVYGLVLSWEGRYDEARRELRQVLQRAPDYLDARIALMNVEWWSGQTSAAREAADSILATNPGNPQARLLRERLEAATRPWGAGVAYAVDSFSDDRAAWHEAALSLSRLTPVGPLTARISQADRFERRDRQFEVEFYPRIRTGTYAFVALGVSRGSVLYPSFRVSTDLYHSIGRGIELSAGFRRLDFEASTDIVTASATKYLGNWMMTGKVFHVFAEGPADSTSYHGAVRRFLRGDGTSYIGVTYGHGFAREEIRNTADLTTIGSDTVHVESVHVFRRRLRLVVAAGTSRQDPEARPALWQTTVTTGITVLF